MRAPSRARVHARVPERGFQDIVIIDVTIRRSISNTLQSPASYIDLQLAYLLYHSPKRSPMSDVTAPLISSSGTASLNMPLSSFTL